MKNKIFLNKETSIDLPRLIPSKAFIYANSGYGKSWLIRRVLEQSFNEIQQIVIDPEGEFSTLREKYDYILIGKGYDIAADPKTAALLAHRLLKEKVSAIIDIYELEPLERERFVANFTNALVNVPKELAHPYLYIIDEAQDYAPEKGDALSSKAILSIAKRGRKRGCCPIFATQRMADISKSVIAACNNKLIGQASLDIDMKRCAAELGFTTKEQTLSLRDLEPGEFFVFGPAISKTIQKVKIGPVNTSHPDSSKIGGKVGFKTVVPASSRVKKALAALADLPQEAAEEARTVSELKQKIVTLQKEKVTILPTAMGVTQWLEYGKKNGYSDFFIDKSVKEALQKREIDLQKERKSWESENRNLMRGLKKIESVLTEIAKGSDVIRQAPPLAIIPSIKVGDPVSFGGAKTLMVPEKNMMIAKEIVGEGSLRPGARKLLETLASRYPMKFTKSQMAILVGFKPSGGTFSSYLSNLRTGGYMIEQNGLFSASERGIEYLGGEIPQPKSPEETRAQWRSALRPGAQNMFDIIMDIYPNSITKEELGEKCGFLPSGGTFSSYLSNMRTNGMIVTDKNNIRASEDMF